MKFYRWLYRSLVSIRRGLNVLIDYTRAMAYPDWKRGRKIADTENQPVTP